VSRPGSRRVPNLSPGFSSMHEEVGATRAFAHSSWGSPADDDEREKGSLGSTSTQRLVKKTAKECHGCRRFQARAVADAPGILPPPLSPALRGRRSAISCSYTEYFDVPSDQCHTRSTATSLRRD
jgi:hypothetical protein